LKILFLTLHNFENINSSGIYPDFIKEIANRGNEIYVVSPREKRYKLETELVEKGNIKSLRVKTGNITKTNFLEKGISTLIIENQYLKAIKKYFKNVQFNMLIYSTPPITFYRIIKYFKYKYNVTCYLMLKDIFPQNAVDIGLIKKGSFIYQHFRNKEKKLYEISDYIGCMSKKNKEYILKHNNINEKKVEIFPNSIKIREKKLSFAKNHEILKKYQIPTDKTIFIYGGNLGKPQGIDFLITVINNFYKIKNSYMIIVGSGTEYNKIENTINNMKIKNVKLLELLPKEEYDELLKNADVGLIFLDRRFTIPNFPSRLTSYMEYSLPILAATDKATDIKETLEESKSGFWCESGDLNTFIYYANKLSEDEELRKNMGKSGREYLEEFFNIEHNIDIILNKL